MALHQLGKLDEAAEIYRKLLPSNASSAELLVNLITLSMARKDDAKTKEYSERMLKIRPQSRQALEGLTAVALSRGDFSGAVQHCSALVKIAADSYEAWFNLGLAYQKTGRMDQAGNAYREAAKLRPEAPEANAHLGVLLQERGDLHGARHACEAALAAAPDSPGLLWNLALLAEREGRAEEAEQLLRQTGRPETGLGGRRLPPGFPPDPAGRFRRRRGLLRAVHQAARRLGGSAAQSGPGLLEIPGPGYRHARPSSASCRSSRRIPTRCAP